MGTGRVGAGRLLLVVVVFVAAAAAAAAIAVVVDCHVCFWEFSVMSDASYHIQQHASRTHVM